MSAINFHWQRQDVTPRLLLAVGAVTLEWAMIDFEIIRMVQAYWADKCPGKQIPRAFDKRIAFLRNLGDSVYGDEPDEWIVFRWFLQRLKTSNGRRDAIAHGLPGKITKGKRTYRGLMVPRSSGAPRYVPMTTVEIEHLAETFRDLLIETSLVAHALSLAYVAASPNRRQYSQVRGKWTRLTKDNRDHMLPRFHPPPATFRG